jgi:hypothetical protein
MFDIDVDVLRIGVLEAYLLVGMSVFILFVVGYGCFQVGWYEGKIAGSGGAECGEEKISQEGIAKSREAETAAARPKAAGSGWTYDAAVGR